MIRPDSHDLDALFRDADGFWVGQCRCGFLIDEGTRSQRRVRKQWERHRAEMLERGRT